MSTSWRRILFLVAPIMLLATLPGAAHSQTAANQSTLFLPLMSTRAGPNPFGFDLDVWSSSSILEYVNAAKPKWARAGGIRWQDVEPVRGGGYRWEGLARVEENIGRLRELGIEPTIIIQGTPAWAQRVPGRVCSPPRPEYIADFVRFTAAAAARYATTVHYWEIWNEPDVSPNDVGDEWGMGCWIDPALPYNGGAYYGEVIKQVAPAMKAANPNATVMAGSLLYGWPDDTKSRSFLEGILASGGSNAFDVLSFHAYGEWGAGDLLINKTVRIREVLASYGLANKPLIVTEIAAMCNGDDLASCSPDFTTWKVRQANFAARIYAEALALNLQGAFWYTLVNSTPGFRYSHLIDNENGTLTPRPAYYAFLNSALLLQGAHYIGPPVVEPPPDQRGKVQVLVFQKLRSKLYVFWVPETDFPEPYNLPVPIGAGAICTDHLDQSPPTTYGCSDVNNDGMIPRAVNELPQYVEVFD